MINTKEAYVADLLRREDNPRYGEEGFYYVLLDTGDGKDSWEVEESSVSSLRPEGTGRTPWLLYLLHTKVHDCPCQIQPLPTSHLWGWLENSVC